MWVWVWVGRSEREVKGGWGGVERKVKGGWGCVGGEG